MRRASDLAIAALPGRFGEMETRVTRIEDGLRINTAVTNDIFVNTRTLIEGIQSATSFWAFMARWASRLRRWTYTTAKWVAAIAIALTTTWAAAKAVFNVDLSATIMHWWNS